MVASLHAAELEVGLASLQNEPQVDRKPRHVYCKRPVGVEHSLPADHLPGPIDPRGLVPKAADEGYGPHGHPPGAAHLQKEKGQGAWAGMGVGAPGLLGVGIRRGARLGRGQGHPSNQLILALSQDLPSLSFAAKLLSPQFRV